MDWSAVHYPLVHLHPYYRRTFGYSEGTCPIAESIFPRVMTLPLYPAMTDADAADVVTAVRTVCSYFRKDP